MSTSDNKIVVRASWDADAEVWVATSDDLPGLVTEAASVEALSAKLPDMVADLLQANGHANLELDVPIHIIAERVTRLAPPRAACWRTIHAICVASLWITAAPLFGTARAITKSGTVQSLSETSR